MKRKTKEQFIEESKKIHGNKYDYSIVNYTNNNTKVKIICPIHGWFEQTPSHHINKQSCPKCSCIRTHDKQRKTKEQFIEESKKIHGNKYDYSLVSYRSIGKSVKILCPIHGEFEQIVSNHLKGKGCKYCGGTTKMDTKQNRIENNE